MSQILGSIQKWVVENTDDVISIAEIMEGCFGIQRNADGSYKGNKDVRIMARTKLGHALDGLYKRGFIKYVKPRRNINAVILTKNGKELKHSITSEGR